MLSRCCKCSKLCQLSSSISNLENNITSPSNEETPYMLDCLHIFCGACMMGILSSGYDTVSKSIMCSICKLLTSLNFDDNFVAQNSFKNNVILKNILENLNSKSNPETESKMNLLCGLCEDGVSTVAIFVCMDCSSCNESSGVPLCSSCKYTHAKFKAFKSHSVLSIDEYFDRINNASIKRQKIKCNLHQLKEIDYFCSDCDLSVCQTCFILDHSGHVIIPLEAKATKEKANIKLAVDNISTQISRVEIETNISAQQLADCDKHSSIVHRQVDFEFDRIINALEKRRKEAHSGVESKSSVHSSSLRKCGDDCNLHFENLKLFSSIAKNALSFGSDLGIVLSSNSIQSRLNALSSQPFHLPHLPDAQEVISVPTTTSKLLNEVYQLLDKPQVLPIKRGPGFLGGGPSKSQHSHTRCGLALQIPRLGSRTNALIFVADQTNNIIQTFNVVTGQSARSLGMSNPADMNNTSSSKKLSNPYGVALRLPDLGSPETDALLYVSEVYGHCISVFNASTGVYIDSIGEGPGDGLGQFDEPRGIAILEQQDNNSTSTSSEGELGLSDPLLFVADTQNHRVQVFSTVTKKFVGVIGGGQGSGPDQLDAPKGIALSPAVHIPVPALPLPTTIHSPLNKFSFGSSSICGSTMGDVTNSLYSSSSYYLFVADAGNHRIQVFDAISGDHVRSIGDGLGAEPGQLNVPVGLALYVHPRGSSSNSSTLTPKTGEGLLLFVSDFENNRIQIFNAMTGQFIRAIGSKGKELGQLNGPHTIAVHPRIDGTLAVFVSEFYNHRIQVFVI